MAFNYNSGNPRFAAYALGSQTPVKLYSYVEKSLTDFTIESEVSVFISETKGIQVTYVPADASDKDGIVWTSLDGAIATVDSDGKVTGVAVGDATITAKKTINKVEVSRTCTVHVLNNIAAHEGTQADPFTVDDAVKVTKGVFTKVASGAAVNLENTYYISGILTKYVSRTTSQLTFWLGDNKDQQSAATGAFEIYCAGKVKGVNLADAFETNGDVVNHFDVGDVILAKGIFTLYNTTAETSSGSADILSSSRFAAYDYATAFNYAIGGICDPDGKTALDQLTTAWGSQATAFSALDLNAKAILHDTAHSASGTNEIKKALAKYDYIVGRYELADFMNRLPANPGVLSHSTMPTVNSSAVLIVAIVSIGALAIGGVIFIIRKRKHND